MLVAAFALVATSIQAKIWMPAIFDSNMVLQQDTEVKLWGTASAQKTVYVTTSWNNRQYTATADANGRWSILVSTPKASFDEYAITVSENKKAKDISFTGVLIGEVWLCAGQSNMEMPMKGFLSQPIENGNVDIMHSTDKYMRLYQAKRISLVEPTDTTKGKWNLCEPVNVREFSATAYYFGRELRLTLNVPVGLVVTAWGGSSCEAWMNRDNVRPFVTEKSPYQIPYTKEDIKSPNRQPTVLYNGMLHPIIGYGIRGAIWYQGEDNVPRYQDYAQQMQTMVGEWRKEWGVGEFPFYYCQIAPYDYSRIGWNYNSALLREQQYIAEQQIPNVGMAVLMDAGIEKGIHPPKKNIAGQRLAMLAMTKTYGMQGVTASSARFKQMHVEDGIAFLEFENSKMCLYGKDNTFTSENFEIAGEDRVFHKAKVELYKYKMLKVSSPDVPNPVAVRYAFRNWVDGDLFCDGMPVSSFRTDNWLDAVDAQDKKAEDYDKR